MNKLLQLEKVKVNETDHPKEIMYKIDDSIVQIENAIDKLIKSRNGKVIQGVWVIFWNHILEEWGAWSHETNKIVRNQIKIFKQTISHKVSKDNEEKVKLCDKYRCVYAYWWNRFNFLQCKHSKRPGSIQYKIIRKKQIHYLEKASDTLSKLITGEINHSQVSEKFNAAIRSFQTLEPNFEKEKIK